MAKTAEVRIGELLERLEVGGESALVDRIHARFATHAQATLRWSTTDPPLAQVPSHLFNFIGPDRGWPWFMYDWSVLHLWLTGAYARDQALLTALRNGDDIHTLNAVDLFQLRHPTNRRDPHGAAEDIEWRKTYAWQGSDDQRRVIAKRFIYRILKGGDYTKPPDTIPLDLFGGKRDKFVKAATAWAHAHAPVIQWQAGIKAQVRNTGAVRTASGKRRRFSDRSEHSQRAGIDYLCQATEVEILNETILETQRVFGDGVRFKFQRHDFICWGVREDLWNSTTLIRLADIAERVLRIGVEEIKLEAKFYTRQHMEEGKTSWKRPS